MKAHNRNCSSLRGPFNCDCGLEPRRLHTGDCKIWNGAGQCTCEPTSDDGVKQPSDLTVSGHEVTCASLYGPSHCDCSWRFKPKPSVSDDGVKSPSHYQLFEGVEAIEVIARSMTQEMFKGYCLGNILKYRLRAGKKSELATLEKDMAKATFYLELYTKYKGLCYDAK